MTWKPTGVALATLGPGTTRELLIGTAMLLLARVGPLVYAVDSVCPHVGGLLSDGVLGGRRLTCPVHGAVFDVANGNVLVDPFGIDPPEGGVGPLSCYPTRIVDGMIEVDLGA
jgi:nitrite reductase/ring-hydroxylating ferredoxin subunit